MTYPNLPGERPLTADDVPALGQLAHAAFRGGDDDEGETLDEHISELAKTLAGEYGPVLFRASLGCAPVDELVGAIVVTVEHGGPFIPYCLVEPAWQGQGIGTRLILRSAAQLTLDGQSELTLATVKGGCAERLYRRLGFRTRAPSHSATQPRASPSGTGKR